MAELTHFDERGASRMVDVSGKEVTARSARASGLVRMEAATLALILDRKMAKGDVLEVARLAGIMAAKRTGDLIPLCHPLGLESVEVAFTPVDAGTLRIEATAKVRGRTGVEMEALTAVATAGLALIDMIKAVDPAASLDAVRVLRKEGGKTGLWERPASRDRSVSRSREGS